MKLGVTLFFGLFAVSLLGCGLTYQDQVRPSGLTNYRILVEPSGGVAGIHTTGLPTTAAAQEDLRELVEWPGRSTVRVYFHDDAEGDETWAAGFGWKLEPHVMMPEDDKPLTIFVRPDERVVFGTRDLIWDYHQRGWTVVMGCVHNRERGQLMAAEVGMKFLGWSKDEATDYMDRNGSRWRWTPGLIDFYLVEAP